MVRTDIAATALVLADILKPVNFLSLYLQEDCGTFTQLPTHVKSCTDDLEAIIQQYQQHNYEGLQYMKCQSMFDVIDERTELARRLRGQQNDQLTPEDYLRQYGIPMVYKLKAEIEDAFVTPEPVLSTFRFLEPNNLPEDISLISQYGKGDARTLAEFYGREKVDVYENHHCVAPPDLGDANIIYEQLLDFRRPMFTYKAQGHDTLQKVYQHVTADPACVHAFPVIPAILKMALLIPSSTAVVERGFSLMNNICTDIRTLDQSTLDSLMRINCFIGTLTDEDYENLVDDFKAYRSRQMDL